MRKINIFKWKTIFLSTFVMSSFTNVVIAQTKGDTVGVPQLSSLSTQGIFLDRIQNLDEELKQIKADIKASEIKLMQIKSQVISSENTESRLTIRSKNEMGPAYILLESIYRVDGQEIAKLLTEDSKIPVYSSLIPEGVHQIEVEKLYKRKAGSLLAEARTFRLKNSAAVITILGKTAYVDVVAVQKDKRSEETLAIRFDYQVLPNEASVNAPVSVLEMSSLKNIALAKETSLTIVVKESMNPSLVLEKQTVFIDKQFVATLTPSLVTENGQIIFDNAVNPGLHTIHSVLEYQVSGKLAALLKTRKIKLKFSDQVSIKPGYKTTLYLKGYEKEAYVVLSEKEGTDLTDIKEELLREQQATVEPKQAFSHG